MTPLVESVQKGEVYEPKQSTGMCWKQATNPKVHCREAWFPDLEIMLMFS